jgi:hypothetical protein
MKAETLTNGKKVAAEAKAEADVFEIANLEAWSLNERLKRCVNTGLSPEAFLQYIELSLLLEELINKRNKAITMLMNSYEIMKTEQVGDMMVWPFQKHPKKDEILEKLHAINNQMVKLSPVKFISPEEFQEFTSKDSSGQPIAMGDVVSLSKILMKR